MQDKLDICKNVMRKDLLIHKKSAVTKDVNENADKQI